MVVKEKLCGELTVKEIMKKHGIKNRSQIETWMRWYRANEIYPFNQPIGKQFLPQYQIQSVMRALGMQAKTEIQKINTKMA